jgi:predicted MFS family arabinose efflux permease
MTAKGISAERVIVAFAAVLALDSADLTTLGAVATHVEPAFGIDHTELGLLATVTALVGAVGTLPAGVLADRLTRTRLLGVSILLWSVAMVATALAPTYGFMLCSRVALGAVTATAGPALASLVGDYFVPGERARVYGYILSGELVGTGLGFVVSGLIADFASWRLSFGWLAIFGLVVAWLVGRRTPEPARDGSSRLSTSAKGEEPAQIEGAKRLAAERGIPPNPGQVLRSDARRLSFGRTALYVLRIRTNVILIVAGAVGYFFFAGLRTFGLIFARGQLGAGQPATIAVLFVAGMGSLIGVVASGRIADGLLKRGRLNARIVVGAAALCLAPLLVAPALFVGTVVLAVPIWALLAAALAAPNPPLDAGRLDIVPAAIWGRAEAIRSAAKALLQAAAPLVFGAVAVWLGNAGRIPSNSGGHISPAVVSGLRDAFLLMLIPLFASGAIVWLARRTYRRDVATAMASDEAQRRLGARPRGRTRSLSRPWRRPPSPERAHR